MADPPQIERGAGGDPTAPPLEQGQATELNQAAAQPATPEPGLDQQPPLPALTPPPQPARPNLGTDEEKFLFGPSANPGEPIGTPPTQAQPTLQETPDWLPLLQQTAADPTAPQQVRDLFDIISNGLP